jgi:6-phosphogluconate dehydrogenase
LLSHEKQGQNFALNMAEHGFKVCVGNRTQSKVDITVQRAKDEGNLPLVGAESPEDLIGHLKKPRKVIILVQAGQAVDDTISVLSRCMEPGDVIIDGGNEWFPNSIRRSKFLEPKNIHFIAMGISGGEEGARNGPSLMPGGPMDAYDLVAPILTKVAAQVEQTGPCCGYLGPIGAGNYVRRVLSVFIVCTVHSMRFNSHSNSAFFVFRFLTGQNGAQWYRIR